MVGIPFNIAAPLGQEQHHVMEAVTAPGGSKFTSLCERWLERRLSVARVLLTPSATAALEMSALLLDLQPGDEVIMPSFTFVSTASAFVLRGAVPVFIDIRPDTLNIDEAKIQSAVTPRTRAICVVHYAGTACAMASISAIAARHGLALIEDAAHALLAEYRGQPLGGIGRFGALSFHATKNITCGQGGALLIRDSRDAARAEVVHEKGTDRAQFLRGDVQKYSWVDLGSSFSLSELCAAYLFGQLEAAEAATARRMAICAAYRQGLVSLEQDGLLRLPVSSGVQRGNGHIFYVLAADPATRTALLTHLKARGIDSAFHFVPLHTSPAGQRYGRAIGAMAVTEIVSTTILRLPLFSGMTDAQVDLVCREIQAFYLQQQRRVIS